jgi:LysR family glycine cleavage system transcriptional activator
MRVFNASTEPGVIANAERFGRRLPSLNLFRAFEAAARHRSFRLAAQELCVTPSAVSQQIRHLEEYLRTPLFRRLPRQIELTRDGIMLAAEMNEALHLIGRACDRILEPEPASVIYVDAVAAFASRWLIARMKGFMELHPGIRITLVTSGDWGDAVRPDADIAIRWGKRVEGVPADAEALQEPLFLVCSPQLLRSSRLERPEDLVFHTGLQVIDSGRSSSFGGTTRKPMRYRDLLYFSDPGLMLDAAVQGQGVCLTSYLLAEEDLRARRLVRLFANEVTLTHQLYLSAPAGDPRSDAVAIFETWLRCEIERSLFAARGEGAPVAPARLEATASHRGTPRLRAI